MAWEYTTSRVKAGGFFGGKVELDQLEAELNRFGEENWELVNAFDTSYGQGTTRDVLLIFKRPKN